MVKKKLLPSKKSPILRSTTAKPIPGLSEAPLTTGWAGEAHRSLVELSGFRFAAKRDRELGFRGRGRC